MSTDLTVKIKKPISSTELLINARDLLKVILSMRECPELTIEILDKGQIYPIDKECIIQKKDGYLIGITGFEEKVGLIIIDITLDWVDDIEEAGEFATATVGATRSELEYALATSVAIALGKNSETNVIDDSYAFNKVYEQSAEDFLESIKVEGVYDDIIKASKALWSNMPLYEG